MKLWYACTIFYFVMIGYLYYKGYNDLAIGLLLILIIVGIYAIFGHLVMYLKSKNGDKG